MDYDDHLVNISAPAGRLGVILVDNRSGGVMVSTVNDDSPLAGSIEQGDQIMSIDGIDVSQKCVTDIMTILQHNVNHKKMITIARSTPHSSVNSNYKMSGQRGKLLEEGSPKAIHHSKNQSKKNSKKQYQNNCGPEDSHVETSHGKQFHNLNVNFAAAKSKVDTNSTRTALETDSNDPAPPPPHSMEYDNSIEKSKSKSKAAHARILTTHKTKKPNLVTSSLGDASPIPATMEFDTSENKMRATGGKSIHSRGIASNEATPISVNVNDTEPPAPYSMEYDDSIQKAKSKAGCFTTSTCTDSTLGSQAKHPPALLEIPSAADEMSTISSSTFENLPRGIHFGRQQRNHESLQQQSNIECNRDVEECLSQEESSSGFSSQEDILAEAHQVYDAELVQPEQPKSPQVVVNLHSQQYESTSSKMRGKRWHENKCFVTWIILIPLIVAGTVTGVVVALNKKGGGSNPSGIHGQTTGNQVNITNAFTLIMPPTHALADTYYCGLSWNAVNEDCSSATPCPSGSNSECPVFEDCIPYTNCGKNFVFLSDSTVQGGGPDVDDVKSTFYCGATMDSDNFDCDESTPCPNGPSDCTKENEGCFAFTRCNAEVPPETFINTTFVSKEFLYHTSSSPTFTQEDTTTTMINTGSNSADLTDSVATTTSTTATTSFKMDTITTTSTTVTDTTTTTTFSANNDSPDTSLPSVRDSGHDFCESAITIRELPSIRAGTTTTATSDFESSLEETCGASLESRGVWYTFPSLDRRVVRIEYQLFATGIGKSSLSVFTDACSEGLRSCIGNAQAESHYYSFNDLLIYEFLAESDVDYYFFLAGENSATVGEYQFNVTEHPIPSNDVCESAIELKKFPSSIMSGSLVGATPDFDGADAQTCVSNIDTRGVWYKVEGRGAVIKLEYQLKTVALGNSKMAIFTGSYDNLVCWNSIEGEDHYYNENDVVSYEFHAEKGEIYWILLSGEHWYTVGKYDLKMTEHEVPENDSCDKAISFQVASNQQYSDKSTTIGATPDFVESSSVVISSSCIANWYTRGVWYRFEGNGAIVRIEYQLNSVAGGDSDLSVFTGDCANPKCVSNVKGADGYYGVNEVAVHDMVAERGESYYILLTGELFTAAGEYSFSVTEYEIPQNDDCKNASVIESFPFSQRGTTIGATPDFDLFDDRCGGGLDSRGIWYMFTGNNKVTTVSFSMPNLAYGTSSQLSLFSGSCNNLKCEADFGGLDKVSFHAANGVNYRLLLSGTEFWAYGDFDLHVSQFEPPSNDSCESSISMTAPFTDNNDLTGATPDFGGVDNTCGNGWSGVWYSFTGDGKAYMLNLNTVVTDYYFQCEMNIFRGACDELTCVSTFLGSGSNAAVGSDPLLTTSGVKYWIHVASNVVSYDSLPFQISSVEVE